MITLPESPPARCPQCGATLEEHARIGFCSRCAAAVSLGEPETPAASEEELSSVLPRSVVGPPAQARFGDYELLEEIARGGMGVVYRARQRSLSRIVAVKMLLFAGLANAERLRRFRTEAAAASALEHPNIVRILDAGEQSGQPFLAMEYVPGRDLARSVTDRPLAARQAATYVEKIARAVQFAHQHGILHRDLKPSNVLVDAFDEPRLTDFGLARNLDDAADLTRTGQALGSANFMAPEQAAGDVQRIGPVSDVYGLGAILYHLLTGRPPFMAETFEATLRLVLDRDPVAPHQTNPSVPADLETICLKCLEKDQAKRYAGAQELADDLARFLRHEPIQARPVSPAERAWRWCRRKPSLATLGGVALLLLLIILIGVPIALFRINRAKVQAERNLYSADMKFASEALRDGALTRAEELLHRHQTDKAELRGLEWRFLWQALQQRKAKRTLTGLPHKGFSMTHLYRVKNTLYNVEETSDQIRAWDTGTWERLPLVVPPQPPSVHWWWQPAEEAAVAVDPTNRTLTVYQLPSFERGVVIPLHGSATQAVISPDRRILAVGVQDAGDDHVVVWDIVRNLEVGQIGHYSSELSHLAFSADSRFLCVGCKADGVIELWDVASLKSLPSPPKMEGGFERIEFIGDGRRLLFSSPGSDALYVWDWHEEALAAVEQAEVGRLDSFGVSPNGETIVTTSEDRVELHGAKDLRTLLTLRGHLGYIATFEFSPNCDLLATGSYDHSAKIWDLKTGRELATLGGHADIVSDLVFSSDGKALVTIGGEGEIKVWDLTAAFSRNVIVKCPRPCWRISLSPDERTLAALEFAGTLHLWDRFSGTETRSIQTAKAILPNVTFAPCGRFVAWIADNTLGILDLKSGTHEIYTTEPSSFQGIAFSPDSLEIAFSSDTKVMICDLQTRRFHVFTSFGEKIYAIRYSPDGGLLAFGHEHGGVSLWDRKTGKELTEHPAAHVFLTSGLAFSADGNWLASAGSQTINLWPVTPKGLGRPKTFTAHVGYIPAVAFSPDATRLVSASSDHTLKFWNTSDGTEVGTLYGHDSCVSDVLFSRDGNTIFSNGQDGTLRMWEAALLGPLDKKTETAASPSATIHH